MFEVMSRQCDQCLFSADRVVSPARASEIIRKCARQDSSFECHKGSIAGRHIACRGHFDTGVGQMSRIAARLGMVVEIDPVTLEPASADTHPKGGDSTKIEAPAPLSGAVPAEERGDAQTSQPSPPTSSPS